MIFARFSENKNQAHTRHMLGSYHLQEEMKCKTRSSPQKAFIVGFKSVFKPTGTNGRNHDMFLH